MTDTLRAPARGERRHDTTNLQQRLKAAGLDDDSVTDIDDIDAFRDRLARTIMMFINQWHGCPERLCRRHQGCMAPHGDCSNVPTPSPEEGDRDWPQARAEIHTALQEHLAAHRDAVEQAETARAGRSPCGETARDNQIRRA